MLLKLCPAGALIRLHCTALQQILLLFATIVAVVSFVRSFVCLLVRKGADYLQFGINTFPARYARPRADARWRLARAPTQS